MGSYHGPVRPARGDAAKMVRTRSLSLPHRGRRCPTRTGMRGKFERIAKELHRAARDIGIAARRSPRPGLRWFPEAKASATVWIGPTGTLHGVSRSRTKAFSSIWQRAEDIRSVSTPPAVPARSAVRWTKRGIRRTRFRACRGLPRRSGGTWPVIDRPRGFRDGRRGRRRRTVGADVGLARCPCASAPPRRRGVRSPR